MGVGIDAPEALRRIQLAVHYPAQRVDLDGAPREEHQVAQGCDVDTVHESGLWVVRQQRAPCLLVGNQEVGLEHDRPLGDRLPAGAALVLRGTGAGAA